MRTSSFGHVVALFGVLSASCGTDNPPTPLATSGHAAQAGQAGRGGSVSGTGGSTSGTTSQGGMGPSAGNPAAAVGGSTVSGGGTSTSSAGTGASSTSGGAMTGGGSATGGLGATGGANGPGGVGGRVNTGGSSTPGGATTGGGVTGGMTTTGGVGGKALGGTSSGGASTGGKAAAGTSSGGTATGGNATSGAASFPFILGADISRVQADEDRGVTFSDNGVAKDILQILKDHGFNYIRLRVFVNPAATGGYSAEGYCDLAHTVTMGKRVKDAGMGLLIDFHYSDTWADPGTQTKPAAWANLSFADLTTTVRDYTQNAVTELTSGGARPDMVQIGNEIPSGMLFPDGQASGTNFGNLGTLLKAGIAGVKAVDTGIKILLHIDRCHELSTSTWWLDGVIGQGVVFDVFGQSCYDQAGYQQPASSWEPNFTALATQYPNLQFVVAEYSQSKRMVNDLMFNLLNRRGLGTFVWEPTYWQEALFDWQGMVEVTNSFMALYDPMAVDYGLR
jgi:arabinogalactan endo-1,4-beta-galactosidase